MRLITVPFSHFCEKARWGLEHAGVPFVEEGHVPMLHWQATWRAGGGRTVPVLVTDEGVLPDSTDILRFADRHARAERRLYPSEHDAEVSALEERFDRRLGPASRRLAYYHTLGDRGFALRVAGRHVPLWESAVLRVSYPLARGLMRRGMRITDAGAARSLAVIEEVWAEVDDLLVDGRRYLVGDRFTAANLTFAALGGPLVFPTQHPVPFPEDGAPAALLALRDRLSKSRAGAFALRMYREHRA